MPNWLTRRPSGEIGFLDFLNRSDDCRSLLMRRISISRRGRSHLEHLSLPVIRKNRNFHALCESSGLGLTDGCDHGLTDACALANIWLTHIPIAAIS